MCIAIVKEKGIAMPSKETLKICWENNSDGAGYMYLKDGKVHIRKGFMSIDGLISSLKEKRFTADDLVSIHFRIATQGRVCPENTHPFPVSTYRNDLKKLKVSMDMGIVHNGMIPMEDDKEDSDTQTYIYSTLAYFKYDLKKFHVRNMVELSIFGSRIAILDKDGFKKFGSWVEDKETGLFFSNDGYKGVKKKSRIIYYGNGSQAFPESWWKDNEEKRDEKSFRDSQEKICFDPDGTESVNFCFVCDNYSHLDRDGLCLRCAMEFDQMES